jgi:inner membrane protein
MPSIFTHAFVGAAASRLPWFKEFKARFIILSLILPVLPDLDSLAFKFGLPYGHILGHRGFFHSLVFALILALVAVTIFFRKEKLFSRKWSILSAYFFLLTASHGILDAFTSGGKGIALLSPFDNTRYFFPFTPIAVSPLDPLAFFGEWGLRVMKNEIAWVWVPVIVIVLLSYLVTKKRFFKRRSL